MIRMCAEILALTAFMLFIAVAADAIAHSPIIVWSAP